MSSAKNRREGGFVFSTRFGELCGTCNAPIAQCRCPRADGTPRDGVVRVKRETKGRRGKGVTLVVGVPLEGDALKKLVKELKAKCATGGKLSGDTIELQGEHRAKVLQLLEGRGWTIRQVGG